MHTNIYPCRTPFTPALRFPLTINVGASRPVERLDSVECAVPYRALPASSLHYPTLSALPFLPPTLFPFPALWGPVAYGGSVFYGGRGRGAYMQHLPALEKLAEGQF